MCGITGIVRSRVAEATEDSPQVVRRMADSMVHRGPDGYGEHVAAEVAFAMRKLSIIDLSGGQ